MANVYGYLQDEDGNIYIPAIPGSEYLAMNGTKLVNYDGSYLNSKKNTKISQSSGDVGYYAKRSDTGTEVWMGVGSGGTNHRSLQQSIE